jgi:hypothetical protein
VTVADPDVVGPLAVFPLIAAQPRTLRYQAFAQGGVTVHELEEASVNDLLVRRWPAPERHGRSRHPAAGGLADPRPARRW